ncbi:transmembrane protein, putative (macronuclear) [Tetrahymena thermophila SB210]|uniref:Transmembrane protein, putative n=1 Tax=Tetrahymena thermophila (strain SB210) TaxID=312017 RepID=W7X567_TETTS|nr:transmembrane protein, putative [Tetrahymena thermophila SB210]EWS72547.1 transmembrane protein, putative [Tetrahymena thermophila SB210]|eukprot:XP_012654927.1 transmembrane protein, putative [Tetrahymena thermophila SB210]
MNKSQYQTNFGVAITIIIGCVLGVQIFLVGQEVIYKTNPNFIFVEQFVASPARFNITRKTFNFAFGAQFPGNFSQFLDESIYTVSAVQVSMQKKFNQTSGEYYQDWNNLPIDVHPCSSKDFEVEESIDYFNTLVGLENMYCLDYDSQDLHMEGNFDQDQYGLIQIYFKKCTGKSNCRDPEEINQILTNSFVSHYTNDIITNPKHFNPYQIISRDMYWSTNPIYSKDAYLYYRNVYVETDNGIVFEDISTQRKPSLSYTEEQIIFGETEYFFQMKLRFEKAKESKYHRNYKKLDSILAEIGGIAKALVIIGFVICVPINQLQLYGKLSNTLFKYSNFQNIIIQQTDNAIPKSAVKTFVEIIEAQKEQNNKYINQQNLDNTQVYFENQFLDKQQQITKESQVFASQQQFQVFKNQISSQQYVRGQSFEKNFQNEQIQRQTSKIRKKQNTEPIEFNKNQSNKIIKSKTQTQTNIYQNRAKNYFNIFDIIKITKNMKQKQPQQREQIPQAEKQNKIQNIGQQLNQQNIQQNEQKQQQILTNNQELFNQSDNQNKQYENLNLGWSDYIKYYLWPFGSYAKKKKQIDYSVEKIYQHFDIIYIIKKLLEFEKVKQILLNEDQRKLIQFFPKPLINVDEIEQYKIEEKELIKSQKNIQKYEQKKQTVNILNNQQINEKQRAKEAYQALQNIIKKEKLSEIDKKILEMLDDSILENIHNNAEYLQQQYQQQQINFQDINSCIINDQRQFYQEHVQSFNNYLSKDSKDIQYPKIQNVQNDIEEIQSNSLRSSFNQQMINELEPQQITYIQNIKLQNFKQTQFNSTKKI